MATVRDPVTGRRVPRPTGDPTGEGYAKQYTAYEGGARDVSKVVAPNVA